MNTLQSKKVAQLKEIAIEFGIEIKGLKKQGLIEAILKHQDQNALPKLKPELIGGKVYVPLLRSMITITEEKTEMFRKLGINQIFENDHSNTKRTGQYRNTNVDRVGESGESN